MAYNPYDPQSNAYTNGQQYGGQSGSRTPQSQTNAAIQGSARAHDNSPAAMFGGAANQWHDLLQNYMRPVQPLPATLPNERQALPLPASLPDGQQQAYAPQTPLMRSVQPLPAPMPGTERQVYAPTSPLPSGPTYAPAQVATPFTPTFAASRVGQDPSQTDSPTSTTGTPDTTTQPGPSTTPGSTNPPVTDGGVGVANQPNIEIYNSNPQQVDHGTSFINAWSKVPGYEWLAGNSSIGNAYLSYIQAHGGKGENGVMGGGAVDFPDFLQHYVTENPGAFTNSMSGAGNPLYKRSGNDTYTPNSGAPTPTGAPTSGDPNAIMRWDPGTNRWVPDGPQTTPQTPPATTPQTPPSSGSGLPTGTDFPVKPPPTDFPVNVPPGSSTGSTNPATTPDPNTNDITSYLRSLMQPSFTQEQNDYLRQMRAQGALTGQNDSGGFNESIGRGMSNLVANEGSRISNYLQQSSLADKQLAMQKYQIDTNQAVAEMDDATKRYGIQTNDDLQRWLNDAGNNTLQKYGIDKQDVMERYKAQLALQGQQYSADAQINAAAMSAAVQQAGIAANMQMATQRNALEQQLGQQNYDLGIYGINGQNYRSDQQNMLDYLKLLASMDPSMRTTMPSLPGFVGY